MAKPIPFQQMTVEYIVEGELDGVTPAPPVSIDPTSDDYVAPDDRGIRVVRVPGNLGLIDPDFNGLGAQGDRCIPWVYLDTDGIAGAPQSGFAVFDVQQEDGFTTPLNQQVPRFSIGGIPTFFSEKPTHIPQGSALGVGFYPAGGEKIVRINVVAPNTALEEAKIKEACCCANRPCPPTPPPQITGLGAGFFPTEGESRTEVDGFFLFGVRPPTSPTENPNDNTYPYDFYWVGVDTEDTLPTETVGYSVNPDGSTVVEVTFTPTPNFEAGLYRLVGFDPFDPDCNTADEEDPPTAQFDPNPPVCPTVFAIDGDTGFVVGGTSGLAITLGGTNLGTIIGGASFTASLDRSFPPSPPFPPASLPISSVVVTVDEVAATVNFDATFDEGDYTLTLTPLTPGCPPIVFTDILFVIVA
jgi:hypothetical protein